MRPLRLTMTAFGPYPGTETVDFESLAGMGLFVVAGPNGAGKTSIFDALFYALYGHLPGRRSSYSRLRSDHADTNAECTVSLDFAARGAHWRVERKPQQTVAKVRGTGTTERRARTILWRFDGDNPVTVASRINEVNEQCQKLVGLSGRQFERVALLPQGEFSRVLRENGTDRRDLLRTLFSSEIFDTATRDLSDRSSAALATAEQLQNQVDVELSRIATETSALCDRPLEPDVDQLDRSIRHYRDTAIAELQSTVQTRAEEWRRAADRLAQAQQAIAAIERRTKLQSRLDAHLANESAHEDRMRRLEAARASIPVVDAHRADRAARERFAHVEGRVRRLTDEARAAATALELEVPHQIDDDRLRVLFATAQRRSDEHNELAAIQQEGTRLGEQLDAALRKHQRVTHDLADIDRQQEHLTRRIERIDVSLGNLPDETQLRHLRDVAEQAVSVLSDRQELSMLDQQLVTITDRLRDDRARLDELELEHARAVSAADSVMPLADAERHAADDLADCEQRLARGVEIARLRERLPQLRQARDQTQRASDAALDGYLRTAAAQLAEGLTPTHPCPVCGSCEHPAPAQHDEVSDQSDGVRIKTTKTAAVAAQHLLDTTERNLRLLVSDSDCATMTVAQLEHEVEQATIRALRARSESEANRAVATSLGPMSEERRDLVSRIERASAQAEASRERADDLRASLGELADQTRSLLEQQSDAASTALQSAERSILESSDLRTNRDNCATEFDVLSQRRAHVERNGDLAEAEVQRLRAALSAVEESLGTNGNVDHVEVVERAHRTAELLGELRSELHARNEAAEAARRSGLLLTERLDQSTFTELDEAIGSCIDGDELQELDRSTRSWTATFDQLRGQLTELADAPVLVPDVSAATVATASAENALEATRQELADRRSTVDALAARLANVRELKADGLMADTTTRALHRAAALVRGDNSSNVSLENWVLAAYLRDVVELANLRLARSTSGRFQLVVRDDGESRRSTWGLEIAVEDTVTGTLRPAAGLSGGELFQASLALALGLADVVMANTSAVKIDALFIDEGFGSLDHASVDRVIDLLDDLRGQGAMVGLITHVPALLQALPCGLRVDQASDGSSTIKQLPSAA